MPSHRAWLILSLSMCDLCLTLLWVNLGLEEANPILVDLVKTPVLFGIVKLALTSLGVILLWRLRAHKFARFGLSLMAGLYLLLTLYHMTIALVVLRIL